MPSDPKSRSFVLGSGQAEHFVAAGDGPRSSAGGGGRRRRAARGRRRVARGAGRRRRCGSFAHPFALLGEFPASGSAAFALGAVVAAAAAPAAVARRRRRRRARRCGEVARLARRVGVEILGRNRLLVQIGEHRVLEVVLEVVLHSFRLQHCVPPLRNPDNPNQTKVPSQKGSSTGPKVFTQTTLSMHTVKPIKTH